MDTIFLDHEKNRGSNRMMEVLIGTSFGLLEGQSRLWVNLGKGEIIGPLRALQAADS